MGISLADLAGGGFDVGVDDHHGIYAGVCNDLGDGDTVFDRFVYLVFCPTP